MPILSNVLIEATGDQVSLTTTNLDLGIRCIIQADVQTEGTLTLPVRKLWTLYAAYLAWMLRLKPLMLNMLKYLPIIQIFDDCNRSEVSSLPFPPLKTTVSLP